MTLLWIALAAYVVVVVLGISLCRAAAPASWEQEAEDERQEAALRAWKEEQEK